jgi:L,D-peptidoglycan transpeptidase YkuD (ErfK/YbiS/YcfS/YnhG family)
MRPTLRRPDRHRTAALALAAGLASAAPAFAQTCPVPLKNARRLALVTADGMATSAATVQLFQRNTSGDCWQPVGIAVPARIGSAGMAWGLGFHGLKRDSEPVKREGDKRSPAGIYAFGRSFGFTASRRRDHLVLTRDTICVDDVRSPAYNTITSRRAVGPKVHAERMRPGTLYRQGLMVDYPTNATARAGSCIFVHVWRSPKGVTNGCVSLAEAHVVALQEFAAPGAVIAVLPRAARARLPGCLPTGDAAVN